MTNVPISDERLAEIEAGLWHVSCGPWTVEPHGNTTALYSGREATAHGFRLLNLDDGDSNFAANAAHIARCDPDTIRAMIARIREAEERVHYAEGTAAAQIAGRETELWEARAEGRKEVASALQAERDALRAKMEDDQRLWRSAGQSHDALEKDNDALRAKIAALHAQVETLREALSGLMLTCEKADICLPVLVNLLKAGRLN